VAAHVQQVPANIKRIADAHRQFRREIPSLEGKDIRIALDEWNYWYGPHAFGELGTRYFLKDALGIAAGLHEYFRNGDVIFMANYAQTVNVIGCIKTTKTRAEFEATALPLMLYRRHFGTIPVAIEPQAGPCDIAAALTADKKALTVSVINPTKDTVPLKMNLGSMAPTGTSQAWIIAGDDPMAYNDPGQPPKLSIEEVPAANFNSSVSVKPLSITLWRIPLQ
jgi:alpha-N-arabinofuranosidase